MSTPPAPPGWYLDPSDSSRERWWDGTGWSAESRPFGTATPEQVAPPLPPPPPQLPPPPPPPAATRPPAFWWALGAAALTVIGGLGPWATVLRVAEVSGTRGGDGWLVVGAGLVAAFVLVVAPKAGPVVALVAAVGAAFVGVVDLNNIDSRGAFVQPAWGIYIVLVGSMGLLAASLALIRSKPF